MRKVTGAGAVERLEDRRLLAVNGLSATYFDNADLTGNAVKRIDPSINFNWQAGSPAPAIGPDTFSARWIGQISPETSGKFTLYTRSNDGARLWVNNVLLVDTWNAGTFAEGQGSIELAAGAKYDIKMEFTEDTGNALAQLQWSGPGVAKDVVPTGRLTTEGEATPTRPSAPMGLAAKATGPKRVELSWTDVTGETSYRIERRVDGTTAWTPVGTTPANVRTFADETVQPGKKYFYRVRSLNGSVQSEPSNVADATTPPAVEPPTLAAPKELHATEIGVKFVRLAWNDVAGETGYKVERRLDGATEWKQIGTTSADVTTFRDDDPMLQFGKTYIYRVRANSGDVNSAYSNNASAKIPGGDAKPAAPRELRVTGVTAASVSLAWSNVPSETGYEIQRRVEGTDAFTKVGETAANVTTFTDTVVEPGKTYVYRVIAFNNVGRSDPSNTASAKVPGGSERPARPLNLHTTSVARAGVSLAWDDVANETGYEIQRRLDGTPVTSFAKIGATPANTTTFVDDGVELTKSYIYRVIAINDAGRSEPSNLASATIPPAEGAPARPTELHVTSASSSAISLAWNDVAGELGYEVYRRIDGSGTYLYTSVGEVGQDVTTFTDVTVETGHHYIYVVEAHNAAGNSPYSNSAGATV